MVIREPKPIYYIKIKRIGMTCEITQLFLWRIFRIGSVYSIVDWEGGTTLKSHHQISENPKTSSRERSFQDYFQFMSQYIYQCIQNSMGWVHTSSSSGMLGPWFQKCVSKCSKSMFCRFWSSLTPSTTTEWSWWNPSHIFFIWLYVITHDCEPFWGSI